MARYRAILMLGVVLGGVLIAGCGGSPPPAPASAPPPVLAFGEPHQFADGVAITLDTPRVYRPKQDYGPAVPGKVLQVPITVVNNGARPLDLSAHTPAITATLDGQPVDFKTLDEPPDVTNVGGTLMPGQRQDYDYLYPVPPRPADMVVSVSESWAPSERVLYRGPAPAAITTTTTTKPTTTTTRRATPSPATTARRSSTADTGPGCGQRAVSRGVFNPSCSEFQGYLDPGLAAGRAPNNGDIQHQDGCEKGYIPKSEC